MALALARAIAAKTADARAPRRSAAKPVLATRNKPYQFENREGWEKIPLLSIFWYNGYPMILRRRRGPAWFFLLFLLGAKTAYPADAPRFLVVLKPVADIRSIPTDGTAAYQHDDLQETQALYHEILLYKGENEGWYQVEAPEQQEFSHQQSWQGYPGWIRKEDACFIEAVPKYNSVVRSAVAEVFSAPSSSSPILFVVCGGTKFDQIGCSGRFCKVALPGDAFGWIMKDKIALLDEKRGVSARRKGIIKTAKLFLKTPYLWGGRSFHMPFLKGIATGVDCSGLVSLAYRIWGIDIARDAHEQWMLSEPISADQLKPGDLIFVSEPDHLTSISHVMLFLGGEKFIEAPGTDQTVRICSFKEKFGYSLKNLGDRESIASGKKIYFGRILS